MRTQCAPFVGTKIVEQRQVGEPPLEASTLRALSMGTCFRLPTVTLVHLSRDEPDNNSYSSVLTLQTVIPAHGS
jgi:hypothetical protein